jgi:hypothetical protein
MEFATYCPMTPSEKIAPAAAEPAKVIRPSRAATKADVQTALTGISLWGVDAIQDLENGRAPSREILEKPDPCVTM